LASLSSDESADRHAVRNHARSICDYLKKKCKEVSSIFSSPPLRTTLTSTSTSNLLSTLSTTSTLNSTLSTNLSTSLNTNLNTNLNTSSNTTESTHERRGTSRLSESHLNSHTTDLHHHRLQESLPLHAQNSLNREDHTRQSLEDEGNNSMEGDNSHITRRLSDDSDLHEETHHLSNSHQIESHIDRHLISEVENNHIQDHHKHDVTHHQLDTHDHLDDTHHHLDDTHLDDAHHHLDDTHLDDPQDHIDESHDHLDETNDHLDEAHDHLDDTHLDDTHDHLDEAHDHLDDTHDHLMENVKHNIHHHNDSQQMSDDSDLHDLHEETHHLSNSHQIENHIDQHLINVVENNHIQDHHKHDVTHHQLNDHRIEGTHRDTHHHIPHNDSHRQNRLGHSLDHQNEKRKMSRSGVYLQSTEEMEDNTLQNYETDHLHEMKSHSKLNDVDYVALDDFRQMESDEDDESNEGRDSIPLHLRRSEEFRALESGSIDLLPSGRITPRPTILINDPNLRIQSPHHPTPTHLIQQNERRGITIMDLDRDRDRSIGRNSRNSNCFEFSEYDHQIPTPSPLISFQTPERMSPYDHHNLNIPSRSLSSSDRTELIENHFSSFRFTPQHITNNERYHDLSENPYRHSDLTQPPESPIIYGNTLKPPSPTHNTLRPSSATHNTLRSSSATHNTLRPPSPTHTKSQFSSSPSPTHKLTTGMPSTQSLSPLPAIPTAQFYNQFSDFFQKFVDMTSRHPKVCLFFMCEMNLFL
jgi:hypothetical protein